MVVSKYQPYWMIVALSCFLFCTTGATCMRRSSLNEFQPPLVFQSPPNLDQLAEAINRSRSIQQLQSLSLNVRMQGTASTLPATLAWQRERNFRIRLQPSMAKFAGYDFDIGSNETQFWMATQFGPRPQLFFANHQQFEQQMNRQILPVSPHWLVEAMGIVEIDPYKIIGAPQMRADGKLELVTVMETATGSFNRTLVIDPTRGFVAQILLRDPTGRLLASSTMSEHQYYSAVQYSLPHRMQIQLIPTGSPPIDLVLEVGQYSVNSLEGNDPNRFLPPDTRGYEVIDLIQLNQGSTGAVTPQVSYPASSDAPRVSYRGLDQNGWSR